MMRSSPLTTLAILFACGAPPRDPGAVDTLAGGRRGCLVVDGHVECWHPGVAERRRIVGVESAQEITVGRAHACARTSRGAVLCWDFSGTPGSAVEATTEAVAVQARDDRTCVLHRSGSVSCWSRVPSSRLSTSPTTISWLTDVAQISLGAGQDCARRHSGEVWCWDAPLHPWRVTGLGLVRTLSAPCAVQSDGTVACWCDAPAHLPDPPGRVEGLPGPTQALASSEALLCALSVGGDITCWGDAGSAPPDVMPTTRPQKMAAPARFAGNTGPTAFVGIAGSRHHVCGLTADASVICWHDRHSEPSVWSIDGAGWRALEGGHDHICARSATEVICAIGTDLDPPRIVRAADPKLQVVTLPGPGTSLFACTAPPDGPLNCEAPRHPPVTTTLLTGLTSLAAGRELLCGRDPSKMLQCIVHQHLFAVDPALPVARFPVPDSAPALAVDLRLDGLLFAAPDGSVRRAAADYAEESRGGLLTSIRWTADEAPSRPVALTGDRFTLCVLAADGEVYCGGDSTRDLTGRDRRILLAQPLDGLSAVDLLTGADSICSHTAAGTLLCGRLGDLCSNAPTLHTQTTRVAPPGTFVRGDWVDVRNEGCQLDERGRLICWGDCPQIPGLAHLCLE
jgi:hypothetical protein